MHVFAYTQYNQMVASNEILINMKLYKHAIYVIISEGIIFCRLGFDMDEPEVAMHVGCFRLEAESWRKNMVIVCLDVSTALADFILVKGGHGRLPLPINVPLKILLFLYILPPGRSHVTQVRWGVKQGISSVGSIYLTKIVAFWKIEVGVQPRQQLVWAPDQGVTATTVYPGGPWRALSAPRGPHLLFIMRGHCYATVFIEEHSNIIICNLPTVVKMVIENSNAPAKFQL